MGIRVGLERKRKNRKRGESRYESRSATVTFPGYTDEDWGNNDAHKEIRMKLLEDNPGWSVQGYVLIRDEV